MLTTPDLKCIGFDRTTGDYLASYDDNVIGYFGSYAAAEEALNDYVLGLCQDGLVDRPLALLDEPPGVPGEDTDPSAPPDLDPAPGHSPDAGAAIYRQFSRDRARFLEVLRNLDRDAWTVLAEAYCAYLLRHGAQLTPAHTLRVWAKAVDADIALPPRVHQLLAEADASAESYAHLP